MMDPNAWDWWVAANERRQILIRRKHNIGLVLEEGPELEILQGLAEMIVNAVAPRLANDEPQVPRRGAE